MPNHTTDPPPPPTHSDTDLERVIIALQKTFSRVSAQSARVPDHRARAIVAGPVRFTMRLPVTMRTDDRIATAPDGAIALEISGTLETDVRVEHASSRPDPPHTA